MYSAGKRLAFGDTVVKAIVFFGLVQAAVLLLNVGHVRTASALGAIIILAAACHNELFLALNTRARKVAGSCMRVVRSPVLKVSVKWGG